MAGEEQIVGLVVERLVEMVAAATTAQTDGVANAVAAACLLDAVPAVIPTLTSVADATDPQQAAIAEPLVAAVNAVETVVVVDVPAAGSAVPDASVDLAVTPQQPKQQACLFCHSTVTDVHKYGEFIRYRDISKFHYKCLLTASGLIQRFHVQKAPIGLDDDGAVNCRTDDELQKLGFAYSDIRSECKRARRLSCRKCGKKGACNGCSNKKCEYSFHLPCAIDDGCFVLYSDCYPTYCSAHVKDGIERYKLKFPWTPAEVDGKRCRLCCEDLQTQYTRSHRFNFLQPTCCRRDDGAWYIHRHCAERQVHVAGQKYAKCPNCNQNEPYIDYLKQAGVFVLRKHPDYLFDFDDSSDDEEDGDAFEEIPAELLTDHLPAVAATSPSSAQPSEGPRASGTPSGTARAADAAALSHTDNLNDVAGSSGLRVPSFRSSSAASSHLSRIGGGNLRRRQRRRRRATGGAGAATFIDVDDEGEKNSVDRENQIDEYDKNDDTIYRPYDREYSPGDDRRRSNRLAKKNSSPGRTPIISSQKRKLRSSTLNRCAAGKDESFQRIRVDDADNENDSEDDYDDAASDTSLPERRVTRSSRAAASSSVPRRKSLRTKRVRRYISDETDDEEVEQADDVEDMAVDEDYSNLAPSNAVAKPSSPKMSRRVAVREQRRDSRTTEDETAAHGRRRSTRIAHWREKQTAAETEYEAKVLRKRILPPYKRKLRLATLLGKFRDNNVMQEGEEVTYDGDDAAENDVIEENSDVNVRATRGQKRRRCAGITAPQKKAASEEGQGCKRVLRPRNLPQSPQQQPKSCSRTQRYNMRNHDQPKNYAVDFDDDEEEDDEFDDAEDEFVSSEAGQNEAERTSGGPALIEN